MAADFVLNLVTFLLCLAVLMLGMPWLVKFAMWYSKWVEKF